MQLSIRGKQLDVGEALREHVDTSLTRTMDKYFDNPIEASVAFAREANLIRVQVSAHIGRGMLLQAHAESHDPYAAFDAAAERLDKRLRRYKRRLRDHHKETPAEGEPLPAQQYILQAEAESAEESDVGAQPVVIAEMATNISSLTVSEAVMRMDLADQTALLFRNRAHGGLNMVYRRPDGNIGWIDPQGNQGS
jgi:ribosomal subunit interface protein